MILLGLVLTLGGAAAVWVSRPDPRLLYTVEADTRLYHVVFSPDGQTLATSAESGDIQLWKVTDGAPIRRWRGHKYGAALAFSPDSTQLVSAGWDGAIRLWDVTTGALLHELWGPVAPPDEQFFSVAFSADGGLIAAGSATGRIVLFRATTATLLQVIQAYPQAHSSFDFPVRHIAISRNAELLLTVGSEGVKLWHLPDGRQIKYFSQETTPGLEYDASWGVFNGDDSQILTFPPVESSVDATYDVWSRDGRLLTPMTESAAPAPVISVFFKGGAEATSFTVSTHARTLAWGGGIARGEYTDAWFFQFENDPRIVVWRLDAARPAYILTGHRNNVTDLAFSPDGTLLASVSRDQTLRVWRLSD